MDKTKQQRLEMKGWQVGTVSDFLELTPAENALIEIKLALTRELKHRASIISIDSELYEQIQPVDTQLNNNADATVSIELLIRAMISTGATIKDVGEVIAKAG
jgi:hypothetical protein